jgi:hypothetical protein
MGDAVHKERTATDENTTKYAYSPLFNCKQKKKEEDRPVMYALSPTKAWQQLKRMKQPNECRLWIDQIRIEGCRSAMKQVG